MEKDYGKLTAAQFTEFVRFLPGLFSMLRDMNAHIASTPASKLDAVMADDYSFYCRAYELPFHAHLNLVISSLNRGDEVKQMAAAEDPQEEVLRVLRKGIDGVDDVPSNAAFNDSDVISLFYSLGRSMLSMATYGRSISSLLQDVRDHHNHDSLFKAIRMDRAVIGCPTAMKHIAQAQLRDNKAFFKNLRSALGGPSKKEWAGLDTMRYVFLMLREMGMNDLSEAALEELMVDQLQVYPRGKGDARKALRAHYRSSRKIPTI